MGKWSGQGGGGDGGGGGGTATVAVAVMCVGKGSIRTNLCVRTRLLQAVVAMSVFWEIYVCVCVCVCEG